MKTGVYYFNNKTYVVLTQSLMKQFTFKGDLVDYCPREVKLCSIDKEFKHATKAMTAGNYFESLAIGGTAGDSLVLDLPRLRNGNKSVAQQRIDSQVLEFTKDAKKFKISIDDLTVQQQFVKLIRIQDFPDLVIVLKGTADIVSFMSVFGREHFTTIDLKLTQDVTNSHGKYCWGTHDYMDHIQAYSYNLLNGFPFYYMVYDYKPIQEKKSPLKVNIKSIHRRELQETIRKVAAIMVEQEIKGWEANPDIIEHDGYRAYNKCERCIVTTCEHKDSIKQIN